MANKTLNTRLIQKHDTEANWKKATNFIPMKGEVIIYDAGLVEEGKPEVVDYIRIKIGDGETNVNNLPFFGGQIDFKAPDEIPEGYIVPEGTIMLIPNTVTVESVEEDGVTPVMRTQTFYSAKAGAGLPIEETTYIANLRAGDGWGSVVQVEATTEGETSPVDETKFVNPKATGQRSVALGKYTTAEGDASIALNYDTHSLGKKSLAANSATWAKGDASFATGHKTEANGGYALAAGNQTKANGDGAVAMGKATEANGNFSFAQGQSSKANARFSIAMNLNNEVNGENSAAFGSTNIIEEGANNSFTAGENNNISASGNVVFGSKNQASGARGFIVGKQNETSGSISMAFGYKNKAIGTNQVIVGKLNEPTSTAIFAVGAGTETSNSDGTVTENRRNLLTADSQGFVGIDGDLKIKSTTLNEDNIKKAKDLQSVLSADADLPSLATSGWNATATNSNAISLGQGTVASGAQSFAAGVNAKATVAKSVAIGNGAIAQGGSSIALNRETTAIGANSLAGGFQSSISGNSSIGFGQNITTNNNYQAAFGMWNKPVATDVFEIGYGSQADPRNILSLNRDGTLTIQPRIADANAGKEATLKLGNTSLTESKLAALLAGAGGAGAAVVCNFFGYDDAGDDPSALDTATWNAAIQELEETGKKILILQGEIGYINEQHINLNNLIIIGYNSGLDNGAAGPENDYITSINFNNCVIFGGSYYAEESINFNNSEIYDATWSYAWNDTALVTGNFKMINCINASNLTMEFKNCNQVIIKNSELPSVYLGINSKQTSFEFISNTINQISFYYNSFAGVINKCEIGQINLEKNNILYNVEIDTQWSYGAFNYIVNNFTAIDNIGNNAFQHLYTGCVIDGEVWSDNGYEIGTVTFKKVTLAHNMDKNKVLYDVKSQSGSQETFDTFELEASKWTDNLYYFSNFETTTDEYIPSKVDLEVSLNGTFATKEQKEAFDRAELVGTQDNHIRAYGEVPTINIPILLKVVHK